MSCPCDSGKTYSECCEPLIKGEKFADTPEELMRSRYSAYVHKEIDYIMETHHPESSENLDREAIESWSEQADWKGLVVKQRPEPDHVEFSAKFEMDGELMEHHELSTFKKHAGKWYFFDGKVVGEPIQREHPKIGRNDPCLCGSGKKYKKCCLAK